MDRSQHPPIADQEHGPPPAAVFCFPIGVNAGVNEHPQIGRTYDLTYLTPGGATITVRMPLAEAKGMLEGLLDDVRRHVTGLHVARTMPKDNGHA